MNNIIDNKAKYIVNIINKFTKRYYKENIINNNNVNYKEITSLEYVLYYIDTYDKKTKRFILNNIMTIIINELILKIANITLEEFIEDINLSINYTKDNNGKLVNNITDIATYATNIGIPILTIIKNPLMLLMTWSYTKHPMTYSQTNKIIHESMKQYLK